MTAENNRCNGRQTTTTTTKRPFTVKERKWEANNQCMQLIWFKWMSYCHSVYRTVARALANKSLHTLFCLWFTLILYYYDDVVIVVVVVHILHIYFFSSADCYVSAKIYVHVYWCVVTSDSSHNLNASPC